MAIKDLIFRWNLNKNLLYVNYPLGYDNSINNKEDSGDGWVIQMPF
jgi:hypothetical protein